MKKTVLSIYVVSLFFLVSCSSNDKSSTELNADIKEAVSNQNDSTAKAANATKDLPVQVQQTQTTAIPPAAITPSPNTISTSGTSGARLNPAHGQPGHDCAIAVGAPLTGKGATTPVATINGLPQKINVPPITGTPPTLPIQSASGARLNPAHGAPGHRCEIAVGAPLPNQ